MKELTEQERREAFGWPDPLDRFLSKDHSLPERLRIAHHSKCTVTRLESLIIGAKSVNPRTSLLNRLNLNLTMHAAGAKK
jgi:hypothetical protein